MNCKKTVKKSGAAEYQEEGLEGWKDSTMLVKINKNLNAHRALLTTMACTMVAITIVD